MNDQNKVNRRDFIATTTAAAGAASALGAATLTPASAQSLLAPPPGFDTQPPLIENWNRQLGDLVDVSFNIGRDAPELSHPAVRERHKIYCYLLMKLVVRFWNGNKRGPLGTYPLRQGQIDRPQLGVTTGARYNADRGCRQPRIPRVAFVVLDYHSDHSQRRPLTSTFVNALTSGCSPVHGGLGQRPMSCSSHP